MPVRIGQEVQALLRNDNASLNANGDNDEISALSRQRRAA
jgi:hypothetical protein